MSILIAGTPSTFAIHDASKSTTCANSGAIRKHIQDRFCRIIVFLRGRGCNSDKLAELRRTERYVPCKPGLDLHDDSFFVSSHSASLEHVLSPSDSDLEFLFTMTFKNNTPKDSEINRCKVGAYASITFVCQLVLNFDRRRVYGKNVVVLTLFVTNKKVRIALFFL